MQTRTLAARLAFAAALFVSAGCGMKPYNQKAEATAQWNRARASVLASLAKDQLQSGNFDKAERTLNDAIALDPKNANLRVLAAKLAIEKGRLEVADRELKSAREFDPKMAEADYLHGVVYERWQRPEQALACYASASDKQPGELAYLLARAETMALIGQGDEAVALLKDKADHFEHSAAIRDAIGQLLVRQGRYAEAVVVLRQAVVLQTDDDKLREHLALAQFRAGQHREAADGIQRLVAKDEFKKRADLFLALGECQLTTGKLRDARGSFETAARLDGGNAQAWLCVAKVALRLGDLQRCDLALRKALTLDAADPQPSLLLGYLRLKQQRFGEAVHSFRRAAALDPSDTTATCMIGYALTKQGKHDEAMQFYAKALRQKPNDPLASKLMASVDVSE
ncbi:MAG TPA: tetratricopeptide repeat protein [Tepidisphaeraceae bacterium]|nr:tetratricopeptide repeat protein [Tepidisphaeraceae bacterium]